MGNFFRQEVTEQALCLEGENASGTEGIPVRKSAGNDDQLGPLDFAAPPGQVEKIDADRRGAGLLEGEGRIVLTIRAGCGENDGGRLHPALPLQARSRAAPLHAWVPRRNW